MKKYKTNLIVCMECVNDPINFDSGWGEPKRLSRV